MTAIRFIQKNNERNTLHRYISGLSESETKAVWDLMLIEEADGHFFYENVESSHIEYPKIGIEYRELPVSEADYFEVRKPQWEDQTRHQRERSTLNPRIEKILASFPEMKHSDRVVFKKSESLL